LTVFEVIFIDEAFYKCLRNVLFYHRLNSNRASIPHCRRPSLAPPIMLSPLLP
jgi:hypothetical protein